MVGRGFMRHISIAPPCDMCARVLFVGVTTQEPLAVLRHALDTLGLRPFLGRETFPQSVNGLWRAAICAWKDYLADRQATISR